MLGVGLVDPAVPVVHSDDVGLTRGDGCFEGCRVVDGTIDKLGAHLARMRRSAAALGIDFDEDAWQALIARATAAWQASGEASMRWFLTRGRPGAAPTGIVTIGPIPAAYAAQRRDGIRVITLARGLGQDAFDGAPWLLGGVKTISYAVNMAAQREATRRGADDVIFVSSDGRVLEAPTSSVVWTLGDAMHTTPLRVPHRYRPRPRRRRRHRRAAAHARPRPRRDRPETRRLLTRHAVTETALPERQRRP